MASAAELFHHHAFVDLETTGLDPASDRVIEVGVLFVHDGRPVERISRLFCSVAPLPLSIRRLTGIDDGALIGRPPFEEFLPDLRSALSGWTVVAHNASFERGFLAELLEEIDAPVLDSCELLHYLYPELESYSLESMIRWTGIGDRAAHRALKDCEDTFAILCRSLDRCIEDRRGKDVAELLECLAPAGAPEEGSAATLEPIVSLLAKLAGLCRNEAFSSAGHGNRLSHQAPTPGMLELPSHSPPGDVGAGSGTVASLHEAQAWIAQALERETVSAIELEPGSADAGTSLEAAAVFARRNGCRVSLVIGSDSRLQGLLRSELTSARRTHAESLRYFFLDEQQRYLCRRRAMDVCRTEATMGHEERAPRAYLRAYLRRSTTGDIAGLSHWFKVRYPVLQRLALAGRSEPATTLGARCPHYGACFYHSALSRAKEADVLLVRHATFAAWPSDYPSSRHAVIDEAHHLEGAFSSALARELSNDALGRLDERLLGVGRRGGLLRSLEAWVPVSLEPETVRDGAAKSELIRADGERLGVALAELLPPSKETLHRRELLLTAQLRASNRWAPMRALLLELEAHLAELGSCLSALREALPSSAPTRPDLERDLFGAISEVLLLSRCAAEFTACVEGERETRCLSASVDERSKAWKLRSEPLHVAEAFARAAAAQRSVVLSSAALSLGGENPWILGRLGVSSTVHRVATRAHRWPLVLLIDDSPLPFEEEFFDWAASRILGIATFLGGRALGVFSSQSRLARMEDRLRPALEAAGIEAIRFSRARRDGPFIASAAGRLLLGARSVWHQVELPGGLAFVFIDKLPVEPLSRPSVAAREALASLQCKDERYLSMPYRLPSALVQLRHWLSTCTGPNVQNLVIVLASAGSSHQRDAVAEALEGYHPAVVPWSAARLRIYEALRPIAERRPETRSARGTAGSSSDDAGAGRIAEAAGAAHRLRLHTDGS